MMKHEDEILEQLKDAAARLASKGLLGHSPDLLSMRMPGEQSLAVMMGSDEAIALPFSEANSPEVVLHAAVYQSRPDAGAILTSATKWSRQLAALHTVPPVLFDEQARHIGRVPLAIAEGDSDAAVRALGSGGNVIVCGQQCLRIGSTKDRLVYNSELFEKCTMAYVVAVASGQRLRTIPGWVRYIAGRRLKKDQRRATDSFQRGEIPPPMKGY